MTQMFEMESKFNNHNVFIDAKTGSPLAMNSQNAVIDFSKLYEAFNELYPSYTYENWLKAANEWERLGYKTPISTLLGRTIKRKLEEKTSTET